MSHTAERRGLHRSTRARMKFRIGKVPAGRVVHIIKSAETHWIHGRFRHYTVTFACNQSTYSMPYNATGQQVTCKGCRAFLLGQLGINPDVSAEALAALARTVTDIDWSSLK